MTFRRALVVTFLLLFYFGGEGLSQASKIPDWIVKEKFIRACERGDVEAVRTYLNQGVSPNSRDLFNQPALIRAVRGFDIFSKTNETIKALIDAGADINGVNGFGYTPLFFSFRYRTIEKNPHELLLSLGADKARRDKYGVVFDEREYYDNREKDQDNGDLIWRLMLSKELGWHLEWEKVLKTPRYSNSATLLMAASYYGVRFGNKADWWTPGWQMEVDRNGENYLFYLASKTDVSLEDIVYADLNAANLANLNGETPLIRAARFDNDFLVRGLLREGARADARDKTGKSALDYSVEYDYFGPTFLLLSTADPNAVDAAGRTPLMNAAAKGNGNAIKAFVVAAGFAAKAAGESRKLPAAERTEMLAIAARFRQINLNVQDRDGKTALMLAAEKGDAQIAESLLRMRVNNQLKDKKGKTALAIARENGHTEIIKLLTSK